MAYVHYFFALVGTSGTLYYEFEYFAPPSYPSPPPPLRLTLILTTRIVSHKNNDPCFHVFLMKEGS